MNTCSTCEYWIPHTDTDYREGLTKAPKGMGECDKMQGSNSKPNNSQTLAYAIDHEDYSASVVTSWWFGCNMYEPKPPKCVCKGCCK